ncbi:hypothetical protein ACX3YG_25420 [Pseudomonas wadenswilerensis]
MSTSNLSPANAHEPTFFVVAIPKLILMTLFTAGLYGLYWYQRNWDIQCRGGGIVAVLYMLWPEFFLYLLLIRVDRQIRVSGRRYVWSPWWLACGVSLTAMLCIVLGVVALPLPGMAAVLMLMIALFCLVFGKVQRAINFCEGDPLGKGNAQLTLVNWLWISTVTMGWLLAL